MKKSFSFVSAAAIFAAGLVFFLSCQKQNTQGQGGVAAGVEPRSVVSFVQGIVNANGREIRLGDELPAKAEISAGKGAWCEITFGGRNIIKVGENTQVSLDFSNQTRELDLVSGTVSSVMKNLTEVKDADSFRLKTRIAVMGVRGTSFCVWVGEGRSYICACNGEISLQDESGLNRETVRSAHHNARIFTLENGQVVVKPGPLLHHTDADLEALGAKIGYKFDWTKPDIE